MARNTLKVDLSGFEELITKLDKLGGELKPVIEDSLNQAGETIEYDTVDAVQKSNLPEKGKYSKGKTEQSIVRNPQVKWSGSTAEIGVGFDYSKDGSGGLLITGTPRMKPDYALKDMYKGKKYAKQIQKDIEEIVNEAIIDKMGG